MPHAALLDPQGKAILGGLNNMNVSSVSDVRAGKYIELTFHDCTREQAIQFAEKAAGELLANPVMEHFDILTVEELA